MKIPRGLVFCGVVATALTLVIFPATTHAYSSPGKPTGFVNDFAGILSTEQKSTLEQTLRAVEASSSNEIAVVTVPSLGGDTIENYATKLFEEWKIGTAKNDNGILLLVAPVEHRVRIEVGYGLEGALPDILANQIIVNDITPRFKNNDFNGGISAGLADIVGATNGEYTLQEETFGHTLWSSITKNGVYIIFFGFFVMQWLAAILGRSKSWWLGGVLGGIFGIIIVTFISLAFIFKGIIIVGLIVVGLIFDFIVSAGYSSTQSRGGTPPWWFGGRGGFGGGGGGGFGGFGGGSSGGGGASGRW